MPRPSFELNAKGELFKRNMIESLRRAADELECDDLVHVSGGILIQPQRDGGIAITANLLLGVTK